MENAENIRIGSLQHSTFRAENVSNIESGYIQHSNLIMENAGDVQKIVKSLQISGELEKTI